ncbi:DUF1634 domain-containing protein [Falsochrobactrum sp. TDYN1]|uniref:DUF1634 domain-containing protein n=1 Tax=Falsochrobactrum tianjinense TaxID=2706015 RepID=A0A949PPP1_9HYPH|nr:DUF1634 domain-containing protein [Falsochrobactrum sp. TDYN1]MBV2143756.1 DUF1634 domain-containing protein [Falsochrobactrum sp. TDYN1]
MKPGADNFEQRNQVIAGLLWYGTWFATALIAAGVLLSAAEPFLGSLALPLSGYDAVKAGVAVFILLPVARVMLMLTIFLRERDYAYTAIAALVLAIVATSVLIEL